MLLILLAFVAFATITPSIMQNREVRQFADQLFRAYQTRNEGALERYYSTHGMSGAYKKLLTQYTVLGWKVTRISGQPYPADSRRIAPGGEYRYNTISAELYYKLVDELIEPQGRYSQLKHPKYGDCMVVPVTISYSYHPQQQHQWTLKQPAAETPEEWVLPFEKPLAGPMEGLPIP